MELRDLAWHRKKIAGIINFASETPDEDFAGPENAPWQLVDDAFNEAQTVERNAALIDGGTSWAMKTVQTTWPTSQVTFTLPSSIDRESILELNDVTVDSVGIPLLPSPRSANRRVFYKEANVLQWLTTGPGQDTIIEVVYVSEAVALTEPAQAATLFPYNHRHLLNWSGACILLEMADQRVPDTWERRRDYYRQLFHLSIAQGSPTGTNVPRIRNHRARR